MKIKTKMKFPCGYEYEEEIESGAFDFAKHDTKLLECPLHGKDCVSPDLDIIRTGAESMKGLDNLIGAMSKLKDPFTKQPKESQETEKEPAKKEK